MTTDAPTKRGNRALPNQLQLENFCFNRHVLRPAGDVTIDDILRPEFWANVSPKVRRGDQITIDPESSDWRAEVVVRQVGVGFLKVAMLWQIRFDEEAGDDQAIGDNLDVRYKGFGGKWTVFDGDRKLREGFDTKELAQAWARDHARAMAA